MDDLAKQAEHAANRGEQRTLFTLTKKITNESCRKSTPVKNKGGEVIKSEADQIERWREHFSEVLDSEAPDDPVDVPNNELFDIDIDTNPPTIEEIEKSIKALGNGKSPGVDNIQAEMLKTQSNMVARKLEEVFKLIWKNEEIPEEWQKGIIIKLPKKVTWRTVITGEVLRCCKFPARCWVG